MKGDKKFASDIYFVFGHNRRHVQNHYGNFNLVLDDCLTPEGRVSLKSLLISGQFAILIDPDNNPVKKEVCGRNILTGTKLSNFSLFLPFPTSFLFPFQHGLRAHYHDDWKSIWVSPRDKPRRASASSILNTFPEVPDPQAELDRQRRLRELRRKQRADHKVVTRRNPKNETRDKFIVPVPNEVTAIRETKGIERPKVEYKPRTLGRGDSRNIRSNRSIDKSDEQIGK